MKRLTVCLMVMLPLTAVFALFTLFPPAAQAGDVGGIIATDTTWTLAGSPYVITDTVTLTAGVTLTIEAGVEVQAQPGTAVEVNGTLLALGTSTQPITFTSTTETDPGDWQGITVSDSGAVSLTHSIVRYASTSMDISGASSNLVQLTDSTISHNQSGLIITAPALHRLYMNNVTFTTNDVNRVMINSTYPNREVTANITLSPQPGLEGYESGPYMVVPEGITLTLEPGTQIMSPQNGYITADGHMEALGTPSQLITFTSTTNSGPGEWGALSFGGAQAKGTARLRNVVIQYSSFGVGVLHHNGDGLVLIEDTVIKDNLYQPMETNPIALSRLIMTNTVFNNNGTNRVMVDAGTFNTNVVLNPYPGIEGYEFFSSNPFPNITVSEGVTLTLNPGTALMMPLGGLIQINGYLEATGTNTQPITFTSATDSGPGEWGGLVVYETGRAYLDHILFKHSTFGLGTIYPSDNVVRIIDSNFTQNELPIWATVSALHRLQVNNASFSNNDANRIIIEAIPSVAGLMANTTLTPQLGLEGYELRTYGTPDSLIVPEGITLTMAAGTSLLMPEISTLQIYGYFQAAGTMAAPVTLTAVTTNTEWFGLMIGDYYAGSDYSGSARLEHTIISHASTALAVGNISGNDQVLVHDSIIQNNSYAGVVIAESLHKLTMENTTFDDNSINRFGIGIYFPGQTLTGNAALVPQPGLEGYEIEGDQDLRIPAGITLTVEPGVTLLSSPFAQTNIAVFGRLEAVGTAVAPITFTSAQDSAPGQWQGLIVDGGEVSLAHAEVRYATTNLTVNSPTSTVAITASQLISASLDGIVVNDGAVYAACSLVGNNGLHGIFVANGGSPTVTISASEIRGNGQAGITNTHTLPVDARTNYWGDPSGPGGQGPGSGDGVYGHVLYQPWLLEPGCSLPVTSPTIAITDSTAVESALTLTFTVTLTLTSEQDVMVDYATLDGTAVAGADYLPISGTLTIPAGQMMGVIIVPLLDNNLDDGDRVFTVTLNNPVNGTLANDTAIGTILDDDAPPSPNWRVYLPAIWKP